MPAQCLRAHLSFSPRVGDVERVAEPVHADEHTAVFRRFDVGFEFCVDDRAVPGADDAEIHTL